MCAVAVGCGGAAGGVTSAGGSTDVIPSVSDRIPVRDGLYCQAVAGAAPTWVEGGATDLEVHWSARRHHEHAATITAPGEIADDWTTIAAFTRDVATPMVDAGDLSAPPTEPAEVTGARARVAGFDHEVCGVA